MIINNNTATDDGKPRFPMKVRDIGPDSAVWPEYLVNLLTEGSNLLTVHDVAARLCHGIMIETGFVPVENPMLNPAIIVNLPDHIRIPSLAESIPTTYVTGSVHSTVYKAILYKETTEDEEDTKNICTSPQPPEDFYTYSADCVMTVVIINNTIKVYGIVRRENGLPFNHQISLNIYEFVSLDIDASEEIRELSGKEWVEKIKLDGPKLSHYFKSHFSLWMMDFVNGIEFENRGLKTLPELPLVQILMLLDVKSVVNTRKTCSYMNNAITSNYLWKAMFNRDFKHLYVANVEPNEVNCSSESQLNYLKLYVKQYVEVRNRFSFRNLRIRSNNLRVPARSIYTRRREDEIRANTRENGRRIEADLE